MNGQNRSAEGPGGDEALERLVSWALEEDLGSGDRTTEWTVPRDRRARARILAKEPLVVAGARVAVRVFRQIDSEVACQIRVSEGEAVEAGEVLLELSGRAGSLLAGERVALNFLARLSGVATLTRQFVERVAGTGARILDTRKTTPGWRLLEKAAVRAGGGFNHRMGLYDMILLKENHVAAAGGVGAALERVARMNAEGLAVEVEVRNLSELGEALASGVQRVLLDNMSPEELRAAVDLARESDPCPELEASGNVTLESVRRVAESGVDLVSVGALTHSAPAVDLSMILEAEG